MSRASCMYAYTRVVHGVQPGARLVCGFGRRGRAPVGSNRVLPCANAGENMRRHVERVRCRWRDLGVALCRLQAFLGNRRIVVAVYKIVRDAGMLGVFQRTGLRGSGRLSRPMRRSCRSAAAWRSDRSRRRSAPRHHGEALRHVSKALASNFMRSAVRPVAEAVIVFSDSSM